MTSDSNSVRERARDTWGSKLTFILAAAGSAIGLGNIWGFPTVAAQNGGAAFLVVYLICVVLIAAPVMLAEITMGRAAQRNPIGTFDRLAPGSNWIWVGVLGVVTGVFILSFYSVIAGWTIAYVWKAASGVFVSGVDTAQIFTELTGSAGGSISYHLLFICLTTGVVLGGIGGGIERWTKLLMPLLFILLVVLAIRAVTLDHAKEGLEFYLKPNLSAINAKVILAAAGQAFFSLSLGMGTMITYGSYISKKEDLVSSTMWVTISDTTIAIMAGLIIFPTLFYAGLSPGEGGPGMVFIVLTSLLDQIPPAPMGGMIFGVGFFLLLSIAALTSSVSLLEVGVAWLVDNKGMSRKKSAIILSSIAFFLGIPSALGNGAVEWLTNLPGLGIDFLTAVFTVFGQWTLMLGGFFIAIFAGWVWKSGEGAKDEIEEHGNNFNFEKTWKFLVRYVCPAALAAIMVNTVISLF